MRLRQGISKEEKVARKIAKEMWDMSLDLEALGYYLARATSYLEFNRVLEVLESAQAQKEQVETNRLGIYNGTLF
jgi:hypothetical protein